VHIVVVEPDVVLGAVYRKALTLAGHTVSLASHAQQAVMVMDEKRPDLIVMELQLRQHGGVEFLYEVRSYPEWSTIPVLVHSVIPSYRFSNLAALEQLNVVKYLYKPQTTLRQLCEAISSTRHPSIV